MQGRRKQLDSVAATAANCKIQQKSDLVGPGQSPGGVQGAKPPKAPRISRFKYLKRCFRAGEGATKSNRGEL